jgi:chromosome segregation ATPase
VYVIPRIGHCQSRGDKRDGLVTDNLTGLDQKEKLTDIARTLAKERAKERAELKVANQDLDGTKAQLKVTEKALVDCKLSLSLSLSLSKITQLQQSLIHTYADRAGKPNSPGFQQLIKTLRVERTKLLQRIAQLEKEVATAEEQADELLAQVDEMKRDLDETVQKLKDCMSTPSFLCQISGRNNIFVSGD